jgi:DNA polymerase-1
MATLALNAPIQGSADRRDQDGDAAHRRRAALGRTALRMLLQVHDELVFEVASGERDAVEALVREQMGGAYPFDVPLEVSVGFGQNWAAADH